MNFIYRLYTEKSMTTISNEKYSAIGGCFTASERRTTLPSVVLGLVLSTVAGIALLMGLDWSNPWTDTGLYLGIIICVVAIFFWVYFFDLLIYKACRADGTPRFN
jgi:hypothetical protein